MPSRRRVSKSDATSDTLQLEKENVPEELKQQDGDADTMERGRKLGRRGRWDSISERPMAVSGIYVALCGRITVGYCRSRKRTWR